MLCSVKSCGQSLSERSKKFCTAHLKAYGARAKACREKKKARGLCLNCKRHPEPGKARCADCLWRYANYEAHRTGNV